MQGSRKEPVPVDLFTLYGQSRGAGAHRAVQMGECDPHAVCRAIDAAASAGYLLSFCLSSDQGVWTVSLVHKGKAAKQYARTVDEVHAILQALGGD